MPWRLPEQWMLFARKYCRGVTWASLIARLLLDVTFPRHLTIALRNWQDWADWLPDVGTVGDAVAVNDVIPIIVIPIIIISTFFIFTTLVYFWIYLFLLLSTESAVALQLRNSINWPT